MSTRSHYTELEVPATSLPEFVGWTIQGGLAQDGTIVWGKVLSAEIQEKRVIFTYEHYTRGVTVPNGQTFSLRLGDSENPVRVGKKMTLADCNHGKEVAVDHINGTVLHEGEGSFHPWDDGVYGPDWGY